MHDIYGRLRTISDPIVDQAMAAAMPTADPITLRLIALSLLERDHHIGATALVKHFDLLPPDLQATVVQQAPKWHHPLREVAGQKSATQGPANVIHIIVAANAAKLAYLITEQLHHRPHNLRVQAAQALLQLACWARRSVDQPGDDPDRCDVASAQYIQTAVEDAVRLYHTHLQPDILLALATLGPRSTPVALKELAKPDSLATDPARKILTYADRSDTRRAILVWGQLPTLAADAMTGLTRAVVNRGLTDVLSSAHLLLNSRVADPLNKIHDPDSLWPKPTELANWSAQQTRPLALWAWVLPFTNPQRIEKLVSLGQLPDALTRLAALRRLIDIANTDQNSSVNNAIARFCHDTQQEIAWIALRQLMSQRQWDGLSALLLKLINSPHENVAQLARDRLAPMAFDRLWEGWSHIETTQKLAVGRALVKIDRRFHAHLQQKLVSEDRQDNLRALSMITELNQGTHFEPALLALTQSSDEKVASAAVRALGTAQSEHTIDALESAMEHHDSRVRANAVEAIDQVHSTRHVRRLAAMAHKEDNRPRANAIKTLMEVSAGSAITALKHMLHDPDPAHRISALWVVESLGLIEVAHQVAELSVSDTDHKVKERADRIIHELMTIMSHDEASPVTTPAA